ncbi:MAG: GerMN domain-containing protein [Treponemataceae bacterium]|nr:MAG: GerMN domain-containing protein [Treponemataceae bacterium]
MLSNFDYADIVKAMAQKKKRTGGAKRKSGAGFSAVVWVLAFLVVLILFVILLPRIHDSIEKTDFLAHIGLAAPQAESDRKDEGKPAVNSLDEEKDEQVSPQENAQLTVDAPSPIVRNTDEPSETAHQTPDDARRPPPAADPVKQTTSESPAPAQERSQEARQTVAAIPSGQIQLKVWFVEIQSDGSVSRKETARDSPATDSPLTAAIRALLSGPSALERGKGCGTLIPDGTRLLSAAVRNGVATLNFSDEFQYNRYGVEGYMGQLMQVVYTATAFPTVDSVQFLIEGERGEYIGSEGVWIGSPLSRSSFR